MRHALCRARVGDSQSIRSPPFGVLPDGEPNHFPSSQGSPTVCADSFSAFERRARLSRFFARTCAAHALRALWAALVSVSKVPPLLLAAVDLVLSRVARTSNSVRPAIANLTRHRPSVRNSHGG